jgi:chondroitin 4-sulfotransferase 11
VGGAASVVICAPEVDLVSVHNTSQFTEFMGVLKAKLRDYRTRMHTKYLAPVFFVHINKTGGSSIETALKLPFQHLTAVELIELVGEKRWNSRFSFAFVRNPWDKVASHYHYRVKTNQTRLKERPIPFGEWVQLTYRDKALPYYDNPKMFMPQMDWIADANGRLLIDFVGRFETLAQDFQYVCGQIGQDAHLPHIKQSDRGDYRRYYDDTTRQVVADWFSRDIQAFGYEFDA